MFENKTVGVLIELKEFIVANPKDFENLTGMNWLESSCAIDNAITKLTTEYLLNMQEN